MTDSTQPPSASTFVLRFWREWSDASQRWRGRIEHVESGRRAEFLDFEAIVVFVKQFGVMVRDRTEG